MKNYLAVVQCWTTTEYFGLDVWRDTTVIKGTSKADAIKRHNKYSDQYAGSQVLRIIRMHRPVRPKKLFPDLPF